MGGFNAAQLEGKRFGRLTVLNRSGVNHDRRVMWVCRCDCGGTKHVPTADLTRGRIKSCGCLRSPVQGAEIREALESLLEATRKIVQGDRYAEWVWTAAAKTLKNSNK